MNERILCVDIGTTSLKAAVIDGAGQALAFEKVLLLGGDFGANEWVQAFNSVVQKMADSLKNGGLGGRFSECGFSRGKCTADERPFDAICISGNGPTVVSESGRTLLWNASFSESKKLSGNCGSTSSLPESHSMFLPRILLFKETFPKDYTESRWIFSGPEFLIFKLTGKALSILPEKRFIPAYWTSDEAKAFGIDLEKLPPFSEPGTLAGKTKDGIPVFCGGPDFVTALIGTNTLKNGTACDRAGSSEGINFCVSKPVFDNMIRTLPSVIPGLWNLSVIIPESGSLFSNCKKEYEEFTGKAISFDDFIKQSAEDKNSQGWFILNGIRTNFSHAVQYLKKLSKENELSFPKEIAITGGQANNKSWLDLKAKSAEIDLSVKNIADAELIGDAVLANFGLGNFSSIQDAANHMVKTTALFSGTLEKSQAIGKSQKIGKGEPFGKNENVLQNDNAAESLSVGKSQALGKSQQVAESQMFDNSQQVAEIQQIGKTETVWQSSPKIYRMPKRVKAIIFDIDSTLYTSAEYAFEQVDAQIRFWAKKQGISESKARTIISEYRRNWSLENGGKKISLGNAFTHFGVTIEDSIQMRRELLEPKNFLSKDEMMIQTISNLQMRFKLICVTNNPVLPARKTLEAIGISDLIPNIIGLDTCHKSKPAIEPFQKALETLCVTASETVSVGDRYDMDISLPLEMGMGGILVNGVQDVYKLPELLK